MHDIHRELVLRHARALEEHLREYLRTHRTTRLDIVVDLGELRMATDNESGFFRRADSPLYEIRVHRDIRIRQKLPCGWRAPLPD